MKNIITLGLAATALFYSCTKTNSHTTEKPATETAAKNEKQSFTIDSVKVNDSLAVSDMITAAFEAKLLVLPSIQNKSVLDSIYAMEKISLPAYDRASLAKALRDKEQKYYNDTKSGLTGWAPSFRQTWMNHTDMNVQSNTNNLLTIKYSGDGYTGGAHGYYYEKYKVFDLLENKTLQLNDILENQDTEVWNRILSDNFLANDLERGQSEMLLVKEIPLNSNFYFDAENLYFLYNQYEIAAYAAGPILIKVPLSDIKPFLTPYIKQRLKI